MHFGGRPQLDDTTNYTTGEDNWATEDFVYEGSLRNTANGALDTNFNDITVSPDGKHVAVIDWQSDDISIGHYEDTPWNFATASRNEANKILNTADAFIDFCDNGNKLHAAFFRSNTYFHTFENRYNTPNGTTSVSPIVTRTTIGGNTTSAILSGDWSVDGLNFIFGVNLSATQNLYHIRCQNPYDFTNSTQIANFTGGTNNTFYTGLAWSYSGKYVFAGYAIARNNANCVNVIQCSTPFDLSTGTRVGNFRMGTDTNSLSGLDYAYDPATGYHYLISSSAATSQVSVRRWN